MKFIVLSILIVIPSLALSSSKGFPALIVPTIEECKTKLCRHDVSIKMTQKDHTTFERTYKLLPPVVQEKYISIYAGETIYLEAVEIEGDQLSFKHVNENLNPDKTIVLNLAQEEVKPDTSKVGALFIATNPFNRDIRYNMGVHPLDHDGLFPTSSCPVRAGKKMFESWKYPIVLLAIKNVRFLEEGESRACIK